MIQQQFDLINNPQVTKTVQIEEINLDSLEKLFEFLQLEGFDEGRITGLLNDTSQNVRHSHVARTSHVETTTEELDTVARLCAPVARPFGYEL